MSSFSPPALHWVGVCGASCGGFLLCLFLLRLRFSALYRTTGYPSGVPHPFWLHLPVLFLRWSYGWCLQCLVQRVFSVLSLALPTTPAVLRSSLYHRLPFGVSASSLLLPARLLLWWRRLGSRLFPCVLSASAPAGLPMFGVLRPVLGFCHRGCPFYLYDNLVGPYGSPRLSGFVCLSVRFPLLQDGCASGLRV